ncbi:MAG: hypothetical protein M1832_002127 [Thelocarpon impressellum]|nr:MAG: hypothetical protein M1832_002127 [Thelocarpon impressellum]
MTVGQDSFQATESLIRPSSRLFYPVKIPVRHEQLRCLISSPSPDILYYACDSDIYRLNTRSRKQELLATLPWETRCLAAGHGWLCVGGADNGQFATIKIGSDSSGDGDQAPRSHADVDALLPIDLDPELRRQTHRFFTAPSERHGGSDRRRLQATTHELGQMIVNSVTLHHSATDDVGGNDGTVAVLTNNDKTVCLYSLSQDRLLAALDFPFAMNHATISPRGDLLVAVGDDPIVYFYKKTQMRGSSNRWQMCSGSPLSPAADLHVVSEGCFATAFSPSGHLCAVASQCGVITIFGTQYIDQGDQEAIVKVMHSSRPRSDAGAVRSMCFSPEPWDLLICTEQNGRVCVFDVRNQFGSRQLVRISTSPEAVERVEISNDFNVEELIDPRLREGTDSEFIRQYRESIAAQDEAAAMNFAADYVDASSERRRLHRQARDESPQPFTERERQILEALRTSRERIEAREQQGPTSINYAQEQGRQSGTSSASSGPGNSHGTSPSTLTLSPAERRQLPLTWAQSPTSVPSLRDYIRDRNSERERMRTRNYEPRRHSPAVLSQNDFASAIATRDLPEAGVTMSPPRLQMQNEPVDPWQTIEAAMASGPLPDAATRLRREREAGMDQSLQRRHEIHMRVEQRRRERLRNLYAEDEGMGRYTGSDHDSGPGTAGCAMSEDGRKL